MKQTLEAQFRISSMRRSINIIDTKIDVYIWVKILGQLLGAYRRTMDMGAILKSTKNLIRKTHKAEVKVFVS